MANFKKGDPCTRCGGTMRAAKVPTDDQWKRAFQSIEQPGLPDGYDTMRPDLREAHGVLHVCQSCGMTYRFGAEPEKVEA